MSTLTKVLIVLQVVVALVLCGLVVTYVANADNYKGMYEDARSKANRANQEKEAKLQEFEQFKATKDQELAKLTQQMGEQRDAIGKLTNDLAVSERTKRNSATTSLPRMPPSRQPTPWPTSRPNCMPRPRNNLTPFERSRSRGTAS